MKREQHSFRLLHLLFAVLRRSSLAFCLADTFLVCNVWPQCGIFWEAFPSNSRETTNPAIALTVYKHTLVFSFTYFICFPENNSLKLELPDGISELEHSNITHIYWKNESINITTEDDVLCCISIHYVLCVGRFSSYLLNLAHFYHLNFNTSISFHLQFSWQTVKYNVFSNIFMRIPIVITGLRSLFSLE